VVGFGVSSISFSQRFSLISSLNCAGISEAPSIIKSLGKSSILALPEIFSSIHLLTSSKSFCPA